MMLAELKKVIPSFVARVERPDRRRRVDRLPPSAAARRPSAGSRASGSTARTGPDRPSVELVHVDGAEEDLLASSLFEQAGASEEEIRAASRPGSSERGELFTDLAGERANRRHRPGRGWGGDSLPLRDRLRLRGVPRPATPPPAHLPVAALGPDLGAGVPEEVAEAGVAGEYERALEISHAEFDRLRVGGPRRRGPVRALPRLPDPLRARPQRARGDAPLRASLRPRGHPPTGPSPRRCTSRSPPCIRASRRRCRTSTLERAAPRADHERDPHPPKADRRRASATGQERAGEPARADLYDPRMRGVRALIGAYAVFVVLCAPAALLASESEEPGASGGAGSRRRRTGPAPMRPRRRTQQTGHDVAMRDYKFVPKEITVEVGDTVTFTNEDTAEHNAIADDSFRTSTFGEGESESVTISEAGSYPYFCSLHSNMEGRISTTEASRPGRRIRWVGWQRRRRQASAPTAEAAGADPPDRAIPGPRADRHGRRHLGGRLERRSTCRSPDPDSTWLAIAGLWSCAWAWRSAPRSRPDGELMR